MTGRIHSLPTRRHFLHAAAAVSASGLVIGRAAAAPGKPTTTGATAAAIELDGVMAGWVSDLIMPPHRTQAMTADGERMFALGEIQASHSIAESGALLDWILAAQRGQLAPRNGGVIVVQEGAAKRRCDWTVGHITSVKFPKLAKEEGKKPFAVDFKWQPSTIEHSKGSGKVAAAPVPKNAWSPARFRFQGLPGDTEYVSGIVLPTIAIAKVDKPGKPTKPGKATKVVKGAVQLSDLVIEIEGRSRDSIYAYVQKVVRDGKLAADEYVDLSIDMLDAGLAKTLGTISLVGCGLRSYEETAIAKGETPKFTLTFSVERFDLKIS